VAFWGADFHRREMTHNPLFVDELKSIAWIMFCVVGIAAIGILAAAPLFCLIYTFFHARLTVSVAILVGASVFTFIYGVFEHLLSYQLYRGLLFTEDGFLSW
jgi:hypothetical protein